MPFQNNCEIDVSSIKGTYGFNITKFDNAQGDVRQLGFKFEARQLI